MYVGVYREGYGYGHAELWFILRHIMVQQDA